MHISKQNVTPRMPDALAKTKKGKDVKFIVD